MLAGGSCRLPQLRLLLKEKLPIAQHHASLPTENVAILGCAQEAGILIGSHKKRIKSTSFSSVIPCTSADLWISVSVVVYHFKILKYLLFLGLFFMYSVLAVSRNNFSPRVHPFLVISQPLYK